MSGPSPTDPAEEVERLDRKSVELRAELDDTLGELERRGHEAMPLIRPLAAGVVAIVAAALGLEAWRRLRRRTRWTLGRSSSRGIHS